MTISPNDLDMAVLSALVNGEMSKLTTDLKFGDAVTGAQGDPIKNLIGTASATGLYGYNGWEAQTIPFEGIIASRPTRLCYDSGE